jgi:hypothetical protein
MFSNSSIRILQNSSADCNKKSDGSGFWVLGSRVQSSEVQGSGCRGSGVQRFRGSGVQRFSAAAGQKNGRSNRKRNFEKANIE